MKDLLNIYKENDLSTVEEKEQQKGFHFFYLFPIMYVLSLYLSPFFLTIWQKESILSYLSYLPILFAILNIIVSIIFCKSENRIMMLNAAVLVKYSMIPFFVIGGFILLVCLLFTFIPIFMIFVGPTFAVMGMIMGWLILAFESPYVIAYLYLSQKEKIRPSVLAILHTIFQFFFVIDVVDVMFLALREKKWGKLTIGIIVVLAISIAIFLIWIVRGILKTSA